MTKSSKIFRAIIEWIIAFVLVIICVNFYSLNFTPFQAFRNSERTINYGPSEIIKELDKNGTKIYLARYKNWISSQVIERQWGTWRFSGGNVTGTPINYKEKITYSFGGSAETDNKYLWDLYGYVNDTKINKVILQVKRNDKTESFEYKIDKSNMFIFYWVDNNGGQSTLTKIIGMDKDNNTIYEYKFPAN